MDACVLDGMVHPPAPQWPCFRTNANPQEPPVTKADFPSGEAAAVSAFPTCDICQHIEHKRNPRPALYDGKTHAGPWANMCTAHWLTHGIGRLGTGRGQRLILVRA